MRSSVRCHGWINGLISDFMLAGHLSCCLDRGQVRDEVRGDAGCQFLLLVGVPYQKVRLGLLQRLKRAAPQRALHSQSFLCPNSEGCYYTESGRSQSPAVPWPRTRSEICWTVLFFSPSHMFLIDPLGHARSYSWSWSLSLNGRVSL